MHCDPYVKLLLRRANCLRRRAQGGFAPVGTSPTTCWPWVLPDVDGSPAPAVFWGAFLGDCLHGGYQLLVALHSSVHRHQVVERPHDRRLPSSQRRRRLHCSVRAGGQLGGVWPETPFHLGRRRLMPYLWGGGPMWPLLFRNETQTRVVAGPGYAAPRG